jgi:hypothetical protein
MYNRNYYAQVDDAMMKLWKDFGRRLLHVLDGTMRYVLTLPIRTYEYIYDTISGELTSQCETENRFENLKQHGHI